MTKDGYTPDGKPIHWPAYRNARRQALQGSGQWERLKVERERLQKLGVRGQKIDYELARVLDLHTDAFWAIYKSLVSPQGGSTPPEAGAIEKPVSEGESVKTIRLYSETDSGDDLSGDKIDRETAMRLGWGSSATPPSIQDILWVASSLNVEGVRLNDAPSMLCFNLLLWARENQKDFWNVTCKPVFARIAEEAARRERSSGKHVHDLIERIRAVRATSQGDE